MSLLGRWLEHRSSPVYSFAAPGEAGLEVLGLSPSTSGKTVTAATARTIPALYAGVRAIAEDLGSLPIGVYQKKPGGGRVKVTTGDAVQMLQVAPNPWQTPMQFREMLTGHAILHGNGYAGVEQAGNGTITRLVPWHPTRTEVLIAPDGTPWYRYTDAEGKQEVYSVDEVLHIKGLSDDGYCGLPLFRVFVNTLGLALAAEEYAARQFANDGTPSGALKIPQNLSDDAYKKLKARWEARHQGSPNARRFALLEGGLEWQSFAFNNEQTQFLESRQFQIEEIARVIRIPPHKIGHLDRSTNNNIEHQGIEYVIDTIRVWCVRWEQPLNRAFFTEAQRRAGFYIEHNVDGLLRGDALSRAQALAIQTQNGALKVNEWRELENRDPVDGGDQPRIPLNTVPIDQPPPPPKPQAPGSPVPAGAGTPNDGGRQAVRMASAVALADAVARIRRRGAEKGGAQYARRALQPALAVYAMGLCGLRGGSVLTSEPALDALVTRALNPEDGEAEVVEAGLAMIETLWQEP